MRCKWGSDFPRLGGWQCQIGPIICEIYSPRRVGYPFSHLERSTCPVGVTQASRQGAPRFRPAKPGPLCFCLHSCGFRWEASGRASRPATWDMEGTWDGPCALSRQHLSKLQTGQARRCGVKDVSPGAEKLSVRPA